MTDGDVGETQETETSAVLLDALNAKTPDQAGVGEEEKAAPGHQDEHQDVKPDPKQDAQKDAQQDTQKDAQKAAQQVTQHDFPDAPPEVQTRKISKTRSRRTTIESQATVDEENQPGILAQLTARLLIEAGDVENRLRKHILELIEPLHGKQGRLEKVITEFAQTLKIHNKKLEEEKDTIMRVNYMNEKVEGMLKEVFGFKMEINNNHEEVSRRVSLCDAEINALMHSVELRKSEGININRVLKQVLENSKKADFEIADIRRFCMDRLDLSADKLYSLRMDTEARETALEREQVRMRDKLGALELTMESMMTEHKRISSEVQRVMVDSETLWQEKASKLAVEKQQEEIQMFAKGIDHEMDSLRKHFTKVADDAKSHLKTATETVGTITTKQIADLQGQCQQDVERMVEVLRGVEEVVAKQASQTRSALCSRQSQGTGSGKVLNPMGSLLATSEHEDKAERESQMKTQAQANTKMSIEMQQLRKSLKDMQHLVQSKEGSRQSRNDVLALVVESELLSTALDMQDDLDRKSIALFGYKAGDGKTEKVCSLPDLDVTRPVGSSRTPRRRLVGTTPASSANSFQPQETQQEKNQPVISVDRRCLSCSSSSSQVLTGFKLACLQYNPSPVEYQNSVCTRSELIRMRSELLHQAREQLRALD